MDKPDHVCVRPRRRIRFGIRTLLIMMSILGPLCGWYGPTIITHLHAATASDSQRRQPSAAVAATAPTPAQIAQRQAAYREAAIVEDLRRAKLQPSRDRIEAHRKKREAYRQARAKEEVDGHNPLINTDGTFNMRYHLPLTEQ